MKKQSSAEDLASRPTALALVLCLLLFGCDSPEERALSYYEKGQALLEKQDPVKASLEFKNALKENPGFVPALYSLGLVEQQAGRFANALKLFTAVAEQAPDRVDARVQLGTIYLMARKTEDARKQAEEAYALAPSNPDVLTLKGALSLKLGNREEALRFADAALKQDPQNINALVIRTAERLGEGDTEGALSYLEKAAPKDEKSIVVNLLKLEIFQKNNDKKGLEETLLSLVKAYPGERKFREALVRWYLAENRSEDAEAALRDLAEVSPSDVQAQLDVVDFLRQVKGAAAAETELRARISADKNNFAYKAMLARLLSVKGEYDEGEALLQTALSETDDVQEKTSARLLLAQMYLARGKIEEATSHITIVLKEDDNNVDARVLRAALRQQKSDLKGAIDDLSVATNQAPQSAKVAALLAAAHESNGASSIADELYHKALTLDGAGAGIGVEYARFLLRYGKTEKAEKILKQVANVNPKDRDVLTLLAQVQLSEQDWIGAQKTAEALRKNDSADAANQVDSRRLLAQGKSDESAQILETSLSENASSRSDLIESYVKSGNIEKAEQFLKAALEENSKDTEALILLGWVHVAKKQPAEAERIYRSARDLDPSNPMVYSALVQLYRQRGDIKAAEETLREGLKVQDKDTSLRLQLAMLLQELSRQDEAIKEYEILFAADPRSTLVANNLASLLSEADVPDLDRALNIASRFEGAETPHFKDTLGWIYYLRGDYERALVPVRSAAERMPQVGIFQHHLGMIYKALGQHERASDTLTKAMELLPKDSIDYEKSRTALNELAAAAKAPATESN